MAQNKKHPDPILITGGDPAGIGPELVHKLAPAFQKTRNPIVYFHTAGKKDREALFAICRKKKIPFEILKEIKSAPEARGVFLVENSDPGCPPPGRPNAGGGARAIDALEKACAYLKKFPAKGLLTAPLSKEWCAKTKKGFHGHTDFLAEKFESNVIMLMHGRRLSVIPLTVHISIGEVPERLEKLLASHKTDPQLSTLAALPAFKNSRWAMCGLNPHCGDGGSIGQEELEFLNEAAVLWRKSGFPLDGPLAADSLFIKENLKKYRLVLACYHDQGLIPFKALEGMSGINVTIGLPFVRTSPDHGTAFSLAGKNLADDRSMQRAFASIESGEFLKGRSV